MLVLMIDLCFKSMQLVITYLGWENVVILVAEYDEKLFLPLLIEVAKLLMPIRGEKIENLTSQVNFEDIFFTITINVYT
jgi:hypothetical protein